MYECIWCWIFYYSYRTPFTNMSSDFQSIHKTFVNPIIVYLLFSPSQYKSPLLDDFISTTWDWSRNKFGTMEWNAHHTNIHKKSGLKTLNPERKFQMGEKNHWFTYLVKESQFKTYVLTSEIETRIISVKRPEIIPAHFLTGEWKFIHIL